MSASLSEYIYAGELLDAAIDRELIFRLSARFLCRANRQVLSQWWAIVTHDRHLRAHSNIVGRLYRRLFALFTREKICQQYVYKTIIPPRAATAAFSNIGI